jgi:nucleoside-diphosphate-sugar epimerase
MYVILGATGNTGSVVASRLLDKSKKVRVVGRDNKKLAPFCEPGRGGVCDRCSRYGCVESSVCGG